MQCNDIAAQQGSEEGCDEKPENTSSADTRKLVDVRCGLKKGRVCCGMEDSVPRDLRTDLAMLVPL
jgi:hypothetical protein